MDKVWKSLIITIGVLFVFSSLALAEYQQAPVLEEKVLEGELPFVEERLPEDPLETEPVDEIGEYGGTLELATVGEPGGTPDFMAFFRAESDIATVRPNIVKDYELSEDAKEIKLYLREGLRWSDGEPFTTADIEFMWDDILFNEELYPSPPGDFRGETQVEVINDYEVILKMETPHPGVVRDLAREWGVMGRAFAPAHALKEFHIDYGDEEQIEQWVEEADGVDEWYELEVWEIEWGNYDEVQTPRDEFLPLLDPFVPVEMTTEYAVFERNPYFWAVDTEGNQLPYIDEIFVQGVTDDEVQEGMIIAGDVDYAEGDFVNYPMYVDHAEQEGYEVYLYEDLRGSYMAFQFNQTYDGDEYLGELFQKPEFRRAMSLALDREEMNEILFLGQGEPRQASLTPASDFYNEEYTQSYAEYDPERAGEILDELGLDERDSEGYRLRPDGERLEITHVSVFDGSTDVDLFELANEYWREVGVDVSLDLRGGEAFAQAADNEIQLWSWLLDKGTDVFVPYTEVGMGFYAPLIWETGWNVESVWATEWARWYQTDGEQGEEPPAEMQELIDTYTEIRHTMPHEEEKLAELVDKIMSYQAENLNQIGTVGLTPAPRIVSNRLKNVPEHGYAGWDAFFCYPYRRDQWFISE